MQSKTRQTQNMHKKLHMEESIKSQVNEKLGGRIIVLDKYLFIEQHNQYLTFKFLGQKSPLKIRPKLDLGKKRKEKKRINLETLNKNYLKLILSQNLDVKKTNCHMGTCSINQRSHPFKLWQMFSQKKSQGVSMQIEPHLIHHTT